MEAFTITAFIIIILFMIYLGVAFLVTVLELVINGALLYAVVWRSGIEIIKEKKHYHYLGGLAAGMIVYVLLRNPLSHILVWDAVTYLIYSFIFAQVFIHTHKKMKK